MKMNRQDAIDALASSRRVDRQGREKREFNKIKTALLLPTPSNIPVFFSWRPWRLGGSLKNSHSCYSQDKLPRLLAGVFYLKSD